MRLPKISKQQRILLIAAAGIIFIFLADKLLISGLRNAAVELRQKIGFLQARLARDKVVVAAKESLERDYQALRQYLTPKERDPSSVIAEFLKEVEGMAKESAVSIVGLSPQPEAEKVPPAVVYKADLRLEANLEQILQFLYKIDNSQSLIRLDKIAIVPKDEKASILRMDAVASRAVFQ